MTPSNEIKKRANEMGLEYVNSQQDKMPLNQKQMLLADIRWQVYAIMEYLDKQAADER